MPKSKLLEQFQKDMEGRELTKQEGNFSMISYGSVLLGYFSDYLTPYYDFDYISFLFSMRGNHGLLFFDLESYNKNTKVAFQRFMDAEGKEKMPEYQDFLTLQKEIDSLYGEYTPEKIRSFADGDIEELVKKPLDTMLKLLAATTFSESLDENMVKGFYSELGGIEGDFQRFFDIGSKVTFESFAFRMNKAMLDFEKLNHPYDIQWILSSYYDSALLEDVTSIIEKQIEDDGGISVIQKELDKASQEVESNKKEVADFEKTLEPKLALLFDFMQLTALVRDIRKVSVQKVITVIANLTREVFTRKGMNPKDYIYACAQDFFNDSFKKDGYTEEIERRKKGVLVYVNSKGTQFEYDDIDKTMEEAYALLDSTSAEGVSEIKGSVGCPGNVKAEVNVINSSADFSKFIEGNVLVTSMTRPEFVPLMKKASAIITDEGGITCHAAIVSRELKIPCIIGTKNATRVLKDGMIVEVDANAGIVRIVKKS